METLAWPHRIKDTKGRLHQRGIEQEQLRQAYRDVAERKNLSKTKLVLVEGPCGVGKRTLVHETLRDLSNLNGGYIFFLEFRETHSPNPCQALLRSISKFVDQLVDEGDESVRRVRNLILRELDSNAEQLHEMLDLIPNLGRLFQKNGVAERNGRDATDVDSEGEDPSSLATADTISEANKIMCRC